MANKTGKEMDKTFLSLDTAERRGFIHRDYLAHCLRWSHVVKIFARMRDMAGKYPAVLDIGCGKELPLLKTLYTSKMAPSFYLGCDLRDDLSVPADIEQAVASKKLHVTLAGGKPFSTLTRLHNEYAGKFLVVTCLEMLEHVEPEEALKTLKIIREMLAPGGCAFLSTPVFDARVGAADNHVCEWGYHSFFALLQLAGLGVEAHFGTFASQRDYKDVLGRRAGGKEMFDKLAEYYDSNLLAVLFAPLFPANSRNVMWRVHKAPARNVFKETIFGDQESSSPKAFSAFVEKYGGMVTEEVFE